VKFLLFGGTGQVGQEVCALAARRDIDVIAPHRCELNLEDPGAIARVIAAKPYSAVINAAAYTDVERAETETHIAFAVNSDAPSQLATETGRRGIPLIHISTDYVFDGRKGSPYVEQDEPIPLNAYGRSKLNGERRVSLANRRHVILRTSWVFSPFRKNFVKTILRLASERERLSVVADQRGSPTAAHDVARACLEIATRCGSQPERARYGVYHFAGAGEASWFEFASAIVEMAADQLGRRPLVAPIKASEYTTSAARPVDTRLDCAAVIREFATEPRPWRQGLADVIDRLLCNKSMP
jgi:dTDP-4-dehydrorhamnose reductase